MEIVSYTLDQQLELLSRQESHFMDFKRGDILPGKMQEAVVAFANADGGELFVGIANDAALGPALRIHAFATPEAANNHVSVPEKLINPPLLGVTMGFLRLPSKPHELVLHLIVPKSDKVHYTSSGECYKRKGAQNLRIREKDIENLLFTKGQQSYEDTFVDGVNAEELKSSAYLKQYLSLVPTAQPATMFLRKQRLIEFVPGQALRKTRVRTAAVLLFDDEPQAALPTRAGVKITRYQTTDSAYDRRTLADVPVSIEGPTEMLIRRAVAKVEEVMNSAYLRIAGKYVQAKYPTAAIHEIIANAVLHRDYSLKDDVHVGIYDNRIEVTSPGRLPGHITPQNILDERFMRNPKVVRLVNKLPNPPNKDIGEGLNTAFREMQKARLKYPVIEELEAAVRVTLLHEQLASRDQQIVEYLREHGRIRNKQAREITGKESAQAIYKTFMRLIASGVIELVDPNAKLSDREYKLTKDWQANWTEKQSRKPGPKKKK